MWLCKGVGRIAGSWEGGTACAVALLMPEMCIQRKTGPLFCCAYVEGSTFVPFDSVVGEC